MNSVGKHSKKRSPLHAFVHDGVVVLNAQELQDLANSKGRSLEHTRKYVYIFARDKPQSIQATWIPLGIA